MRISILSISLLLTAFVTMAQLKINSPYSRYAFGDVSLPGSAINQGMGGLGASYGNRFYVNSVNPALLQRNRYMVYEFGGDYQFRNLASNGASQNNADGNLSYLALSFPVGNRYNLGFGLKKYSQVNFNLTLNQTISSTDYAEIQYSGKGGLNEVNFSNAYRLVSDTAKNATLSLGLSSKYVFGQIETNSASTLFIDSASTSQVFQFKEKNSYNDFVFNPGIVFRKELFNCRSSKVIKNSVGQDSIIYVESLKCKALAKSRLDKAKANELMIVFEEGDVIKLDAQIRDKDERERLTKFFEQLVKGQHGVYVYAKAATVLNDSLRKSYSALMAQESYATVNDHYQGALDYIKKHSGIYWNVGFSYNFQAKLNGESQLSLNRNLTNGIFVSKDTVKDGASTSIMLPSQFQVGVSLEKPDAKSLSSHSWWAVGADVSYTYWSQYKGINDDINYQNSYRLMAGGEYTPDPYGFTGKHYFKRVTYRSGIHYGNTPFDFTGVTFNDFGINFGMSMPIGVATLYSPQRSLTWTATFGQRGTLSNGLVRERYAMVSLLFNVNARWFDRGGSKYGF